MRFTTSKLFLVLLAGLAFGSSAVLARFALREVDPYQLVVLRFCIASVAYILALWVWKKKIPTNRRTLLDISLVGLFASGLPLLLFFFALAYMSSGMLTIFLALMPLLTAFLAHFFLRDERLNKQMVLGLAVALAGVSYLIASRTNGITEAFDARGPLLTLVGVGMVAAGTVYARARLTMQDPFVVSSLQTVAAFVALLVIVILLGKFSVGSYSVGAWAAVAYNGLVGSFIAFWVTFELIQRYGATASALPGYVMPVFSSILGVMLLGEIITLPFIIGALLVLLGLRLALRHNS
jgi:drug/metabolite transporter (DMT)-like permease